MVGGGLPDPDAEGAAGGAPASEEKIVWSDLARRIVTETGRTGPTAEVVRALLDPDVELAAWRTGADGKGVEMGPAVPEGTPDDRVIFRVRAGERLVLTHAVAMALGMQAFEGGPQDLGQHLKIAGWTAESDYGMRVAKTVAAEQEKKARAAQATFERKARQNIRRRESTHRYVSDHLLQAAAWDPTKASYDRYSWPFESRGMGWGYSRSYAAPEWTKESQRKWKTRTDACIYFLVRAGQGLVTLKKLDGEAVKLGLEPTIGAAEIDAMIEDLKARIVALEADRDRKG